MSSRIVDDSSSNLNQTLNYTFNFIFNKINSPVLKCSSGRAARTWVSFSSADLHVEV